MDLVTLISSRLGPTLGIRLGSILSQKQAYAFSDWLVRRIVARDDFAVVQGVRANQAVVRDLPLDAPELKEAVHEVLKNAGRGYADWFRLMAEGPEALLESIEIDEKIFQAIEDAQAEKRGLVVVGAHMSSFNVLMLALGISSYDIQALSHAVVQGGFYVDNEVRRKFGLHITPISPQSLREAIKRLRRGGIILTGIDRPDVGGDLLSFFNRKTILPVGHARLALQTNSKILVGVTQTKGPGLYQAVCSPVIELEPTGDRQKDVITLAQQVIDELEKYVRARPGEWLLFLPVWSDEFAEQDVS
jgi:lauroyl/myristoyl acyltransferase